MQKIATPIDSKKVTSGSVKYIKIPLGTPNKNSPTHNQQKPFQIFPKIFIYNPSISLNS